MTPHPVRAPQPVRLAARPPVPQPARRPVRQPVRSAVPVPVRAGGGVALPVVAGAVRAGFPSPAEDYVEGALDLNEHLVRHPAATFVMRVAGESMTGAGIFPGDLLVVDRAVEPRPGHVVIAQVAGELTVKRLEKGTRAGAWRLVAEHPDFPPIDLKGEEGDEDAVIWGVVVHAIRDLDKG